MTGQSLADRLAQRVRRRAAAPHLEIAEVGVRCNWGGPGIIVACHKE
jgi:hypothetical protein